MQLKVIVSLTHSFPVDRELLDYGYKIEDMYNIDYKGKKYNTSTKGFKIDVYYDDVYKYSTDCYKTCKAVKDSCLNSYPKWNPKLLKVKFDKI